MDYKRKFREHSFSYLIENEEELIELRKKYSKSKADERRKAADYAYHEFLATDIFYRLLNEKKDDSEETESWESGIKALAIDPTYAPAFLTVGTLEYQIGREDEAMELLVGLTQLSTKEPEIDEIIDKAGDFLIDREEYYNAVILYREAEKAFPNDAAFADALGYCLSENGEQEEAIEKFKKAIRLNPYNHNYPNNLGYLLFEMGELVESEKYLRKAVSLAPEDYKFAENNLEELMKAKRKKE